MNNQELYEVSTDDEYCFNLKEYIINNCNINSKTFFSYIRDCNGFIENCSPTISKATCNIVQNKLFFIKSKGIDIKNFKGQISLCKNKNLYDWIHFYLLNELSWEEVKYFVNILNNYDISKRKINKIYFNSLKDVNNFISKLDKTNNKSCLKVEKISI
jgi:hypothetical protein